MSLKDEMSYLSGNLNREENIWHGKKPYEISEDADQIIKEMKAEADLLKGFNDLCEIIKSMKWQLERSFGAYHSDEGERLKNMIKNKKEVINLKEKLYNIAKERMEKVEEIIKEVLGGKKEEIESDEKEE